MRLNNAHLTKHQKQKTMINEIKNTVTFEMVCEEARELSTKLQNTIYVIQSDNTLYTSLSNDGNVLCAYNFGNKIS